MTEYFVYVVTNIPRGTLYTGVTNDLVRRVHEHPKGLVKGFSRRDALKMLVFYEKYETPLNGNSAGEEYQALASAVEARTGRVVQSTVAGYVEGHHALNCIMDARVFRREDNASRLLPGHDKQ